MEIQEKFNKVANLMRELFPDAEDIMLGTATADKEHPNIINTTAIYAGNMYRAPLMIVDIMLRNYGNGNGEQRKFLEESLRSSIEQLDNALTKFDGYKPIIPKRPKLEIVK